MNMRPRHADRVGRRVHRTRFAEHLLVAPVPKHAAYMS